MTGINLIKPRKFKKGDRVAIISPSSPVSDDWAHVYNLGLSRLRDVFGLEGVEFSSTTNIKATLSDKATDLVAAFEDKNISGIITTMGGKHQAGYVPDLPSGPFKKNPKPFFGFSDNTHMANFLWLNGIASYYGGSIMTQFAMPGEIDPFTKEFLSKALFESDTFELKPSRLASAEFASWNDKNLAIHKTKYEEDMGWCWDGNSSGEGVTWGGCLESIDEMLEKSTPIPSLEDFKNVILMTETAEDIPSTEYVSGVYDELGRRGILANVKGVLVGRPQSWFFDRQTTKNERAAYSQAQRDAIVQVVRKYNKKVSIIQNMDFGHTNPQIPMPYGGKVRIDADAKKIYADL